MRSFSLMNWPAFSLPILAIMITLLTALGSVCAQELTPQMLEEASRRTGLSKEEILRRYQAQSSQGKNLPESQGTTEPGRKSLEGVDDSDVKSSIADGEESVMLPFDSALQQDLEKAQDVARAQEATAENNLSFFGSEFFQLDKGVFMPPSFGPVAADYQLGVGDEVIVNVWGGIEFQEVRVVDRDGTILLPRGGKVLCSGRTLAQVNQEVRRVLAKSHSTIDTGSGEGDTQVEVTLGKLRAIRVYVVGGVNRPGSYEMSSASRILTALYAAGGPSHQGSMREIHLVRAGEVVSILDLYDYLLAGSRKSDAQLREGDTVFVPDIGPTVLASGEVKRPKWYELKPGETLDDLLNFCGGFSVQASTEVVHIQRILPPEQRVSGQPDHVVWDVSIDAATMKAKSGPVTLRDGDKIRVSGIEDRLDNYVEITGSIKRPGRYELLPGLTASQLVRIAGGHWPDALLEKAVIDRTDPLGVLSSVSFPLGKVLLGEAPDLPLMARDVVQIFGRWEIQDPPQVYIEGEVYEPHQEDWREGLTLRDLVLKSGGLKRNADLVRAEVARLRTEALQDRGESGHSSKTVKMIQVELGNDFLKRDSSLVLQPWDRVYIRSLPWWEHQRTVEIVGEVYYQGQFSLERKDERLSDLIARAGGLKPGAYLVGARVLRAQNGLGNIAVDLAKALENPGEEQDIILSSGDRIIIPEQMFTVKVQGQVGFPTSLVYQDGLKINDYVDLAGGYLERADKSKARVIYPNGLSLPNKSKHKIVAGSTIVVPRKPEDDGKDTWTVIRDISSIVASLATVWLIVDK